MTTLMSVVEETGFTMRRKISPRKTLERLRRVNKSRHLGSIGVNAPWRFGIDSSHG
jgi:hypothetical protein